MACFKFLYIYSCAFICVCFRAVQICYLRDFAYLITVMSVSSCAIFQNDLELWAKEHLVKSTRVSTDIEMGMRWKCLWRLRYVYNVLLQEIKCILYFLDMKILRIHSFLYQYNKNKCVNVFYTYLWNHQHTYTHKKASRTLLRLPTFFLISAINRSPTGRNLLAFLLSSLVKM